MTDCDPNATQPAPSAGRNTADSLDIMIDSMRKLLNALYSLTTGLTALLGELIKLRGKLP